MKQTELRQPGPALNDDALDALERRLGLTIPSEYREFLLANNGGVPRCSVFGVPNEGEDEISQFFVVGSADHTDLERATRIFRPRLPPGVLPIAEDALGNLILLRVAEPDQGSVLFWDHEKVEDEATTVLAASLTSFLDALRADE